MVTCSQYKMLPMMAPASAIAIPPHQSASAKPKIGFSIDSIVGNAAFQSHNFDSSLSPRSESSGRPSSPLSDCSYPLELRTNDFSRNFSANQIRRTSDEIRRSFSLKSTETFINQSQQKTTTTTTNDESLAPSNRTRLSPTTDDPGGRPRSRSPPAAHHQAPTSKGPIVVPGIPAGLIRPFPLQPHSNGGDMKTAMSTYDMVGPPNPHFLAAQFQMAAALAHGQSTGQGFPPNSGLPQPPHHPQFVGPNMVRDTYPLYPWLLSRHGRLFPHRFPGNFLLQPFRKPKRVRTAFSPSQLLKLEHAFENNHYVVGAERKTLAQTLSLTETQVKVWFQNRRTKHKRMQQEENSKGGGCSGSGEDSKNLNDSHMSYDDDDDDDDNEDELIDMDDCSSDQGSDLITC